MNWKKIAPVVPGLVTISRAVLAYQVTLHAWSGNWRSALIWLCGLWLTDFADGAVAKALHAESTFGRAILDPGCDLVLILASMLGLIQGPHRVLIGSLMAACVVVGLTCKVLKHYAPSMQVRKIAARLSFESVGAAVIVGLNSYAFMASGRHMIVLGAQVAGTIIGTIIARRLKRPRLNRLSTVGY